MPKQALIVLALLGAASVVSAQMQDSVPGAPGPSQTSREEFHLLNLHLGGGIGVPLNPTARFAGVSGNFQMGAGYNLNKHNSIVGEFMWHALPPNRNSLLPLVKPGLQSIHASDNLYALTTNYMFHTEGNRFGYYLIGGGGWYYRHAQLKNYTVAPGTVCAPAWDWWGYICRAGFVPSDNVLATRGVSSGGVNAGVGFTVRVTDWGLKLYMESRYHYAPSGHISTQVVPVTFGIRW